MTPATLKTLREAMCLSVRWLADQAGVQERTVRYWEAGGMMVPADVAELIEGLWKQLLKAEQHGLELLQEWSGTVTAPAVLVRYRTDEDLWLYRPEMKGLPTAYHGALVARLIAAAPIPCEARWLDVEPYQAWLKATNRRDSEALRAQFTATTPVQP